MSVLFIRSPVVVAGVARVMTRSRLRLAGLTWRLPVCYAHPVDTQFEQIRAANTLPRRAVTLLKTDGFVSIPGPLSGDQFANLGEAYDKVMAEACGPDLKVGSSTTRMSDLLRFNAVFDEVFLYPPLLEACSHLIGEPFKLSSFLARTLRPGTPAQELHADLSRTSEDAPLLGFILTLDAFREENGATRFVPGSHEWPDVPGDRLCHLRAEYPGESLACGEPGTMILFNAAIWHGHTANITERPRRSIQGYFVKRNAKQGFCFRSRLAAHVQRRMSSLARYLLALD
jgi:hypothetical protein